MANRWKEIPFLEENEASKMYQIGWGDMSVPFWVVFFGLLHWVLQKKVP